VVHEGGDATSLVTRLKSDGEGRDGMLYDMLLVTC